MNRIPKKSIYVVYASVENYPCGYEDMEVARFSTKEKAERCLSLCRVQSGHELYPADENGNEIPVNLEELGKEPDVDFLIREREIFAIDTFEFENECYDWRTGG